MSKERFAILGAGNAGRAMAAYLTLRGYEVSLFNRWENEIEDIRSGRIQISGWSDKAVTVSLVTTDIRKALEGCGVIFFNVPAFAHKFLAELIGPHLRNEHLIGVNPGLVGGALAIHHTLRRVAPKVDIPIAETIISIFACRIRPGGVHIRQVLDRVETGVLPSRLTSSVLTRLAEPFENRLVPAANVLETSLNNINPLYHCPVMLANIGRSEAGEDWPFAEVVTPGAIRLIEAIDTERCAIGRALNVPVMPFLDSLKLRLGRDAGDLLESLKAVFLPGGASPMPKSLTHRFVSEDVPFGLTPWIRLGEWCGVKVDTMRSVATALNVARGAKDDGLSLGDMGITEKDVSATWASRL